MKNANLNRLEQQVSATLQEGDILFISIDAFLYKQVARGNIGRACGQERAY